MKTLLTALRLFLVMTILTGIIYPLLVTGAAQALWPSKAGGSLVIKNGEVIGSTLIAQKFQKETYFWPRPSATDYNAAASGASNLGPTSSDLKKNVEAAAPGTPTEMRLASGSGLDPHISPDTAQGQVERVAAARHLTESQKMELASLVENQVERRDLGFLGEPRVNVFKLNLEVDQRFP